MPVTYNKEKGKWCVGSLCTFHSKDAAERAYKGYLVHKYSESEGLQEEGFIRIDEEGQPI